MQIAPHPDWLRSFAKVAERGGFTAAAESLSLSQPAVHAHVKKLSEALGVTLYKRNGSAIVLTESGRVVAAYANDQEQRTSALRAQLAERVEHEPVVLATGEGALLYLLGPALKRFDGRVRLLLRNAEGCRDALQTGAAHLAVYPERRRPGLTRRRLTATRPVLAMRREHPFANRERIRLETLGDEAFIVPTRGPLRAQLDARLTPRVRVEASGWPTILHLVSLGLGVAVVNDFCRMPRGVIARPIIGLPAVEYSLVRRSGAPTHGETLAEKIVSQVSDPLD